MTQQVRNATEAVAESAGRPLRFVNSPSVSKEDIARGIAERDGISQGLICVLSAVEVLWSYDIHRNRRTRMLDLVPASRKCLHYYHYFIHPQLGFMHARLATWFPLTVHVCINGREWLAGQMDRAGIDYVRRDNCFTRIDDLPRAQALLHDQLRTDWSADESEWASDVMFKSPAMLAGLYPTLVRHGMQTLGSRDVMRFLGKRVPNAGGIDKSFKGEVVTDLKERAEGVRVKHRVKRNAIKMYDKQGSVLRVETTLNDARDLKVYRPKEGDGPDAPKRWRPMRKGVADLHRRAEVCQAANERYFNSLASVGQTTPLGQLAAKVCRPVRWKSRRARALNPLCMDDARLLEAVSRGEFAVHGFRNRDLRPLLHGSAPASKVSLRRQAGAVTRKLRLLRAHGLIRKIPRTHRYQLTAKGQTTITALLTARQADTVALAKAA